MAEGFGNTLLESQAGHGWRISSGKWLR